MRDKLKELTTKTLEYRQLLRIALRFNNTQRIQEYSYNLTVINSQIADLVIDALERVEKTDTNNVVGSAITGDVQVREHTPMNFDSIDGDVNKEIVLDPNAPIVS